MGVTEIVEKSLLEKTKAKYQFSDIPQDVFFSILFEMNRYFDKNFVQCIRKKISNLHKMKEMLYENIFIMEMNFFKRDKGKKFSAVFGNRRR